MIATYIYRVSVLHEPVPHCGCAPLWLRPIVVGSVLHEPVPHCGWVQAVVAVPTDCRNAAYHLALSQYD